MAVALARHPPAPIPLVNEEDVMPFHVTINGELTDVSHIDPDTPLLWALRITWVWWAPNMAAVSRSAAPVRCGWMVIP